jgi:hypothetical protein
LALGMISLIVVVMLEMMLAMIVLFNVTNEVLRMRGRASSMMRTKVS